MKKKIANFCLGRGFMTLGDLVHYFTIRKAIQLVCKMRGHKLQDESWGTPDSGYMGVSCIRCEWSSGTHLY